ncbi:MAG: glycosyltransferase, partial [Bacteriovorax sp.]|nr:glycosyltransferase [Bacteriovorax sp.]
FKTRNLGVSSARNFGVQQSSGNFLAFLDSDDEWLPHKLEEQFNFFKQNPALEIVYGQELWIRNGVRVNQRASHQKFGGWIFDKCVQLCFIAPSSVMFTKKLFLEMGGFDQDFVVCEDYDLWLKISSIYEIGYISNPIIIKHGGHEDQLSTKYVAMDMWRLKALFKILNIRKLSVEHIEIVMIAIRKKADLLMKGYQKHGNVVAFNEVEAMLKDLQE